MIIVGGCPEVFVGTAVTAIDGYCVKSKFICAVPIPKFAVRPPRSAFEGLGCHGESTHKIYEFLEFLHAGQVEVFGAYLLGVIEDVDKAVGKVEVFCHPGLVADFNELVAFPVAGIRKGACWFLEYGRFRGNNTA